MKPELEKLCTEFTASRDAVKAAFRWDNKVLHSVCANIFCANGQTADTDSSGSQSTDTDTAGKPE